MSSASITPAREFFFCFAEPLISLTQCCVTFAFAGPPGRPAVQTVLAYARTRHGVHITSPNMRDIPDLPRLTFNPVAVCTDGRWGIFEYSRWPQESHDRTAHHMCIPLHPKQERIHSYYKENGVDEPSSWFFYQFSHTDWTEQPECQVAGYGLAKAEVVEPLGKAAYNICKLTGTCKLPQNAENLLRQLGLSMRQLR